MKAAILCALIVWPVFAQIGGIMGSSGAPAFAGQFQFAALHDAERGFTSGWRISSNESLTIAHRYFFNRREGSYTGYDMVVRSGPDASTFRVSFAELSLGPDSFGNAVPGGPDPSTWKKLTAVLPLDQVLRAGQAIDITVVPDADPARAITDQVTLSPRRTVGMAPADLQRMVAQMQSTMASMAPMRLGRASAPVTGPARAFSVSDVDLTLANPRAKINGTVAIGPGRTGSALGPLVWIYLPGHGRFVLSAAPRPELGFVKTGELRGATATFADGNDKIEVVSGTAIAPGDSAYFLYVLHDAEWTPIGDAKSASVLCGSVSVEELRALQKK